MNIETLDEAQLIGSFSEAARKMGAAVLDFNTSDAMQAFRRMEAVSGVLQRRGKDAALKLVSLLEHKDRFVRYYNIKTVLCGTMRHNFFSNPYPPPPAWLSRKREILVRRHCRRRSDDAARVRPRRLQLAALRSSVPGQRPPLRTFLRLVETTWWLTDNLPRILSYLDEPRTLEELQEAVGRPRPGYEIHHIVERQFGSSDSSANWQRFKDRLDTRENLVLVPYWKHVEISS
ncbi:MAG: hypothetical protein AB7H90_11360 [Alphaproteobacteria bacterium]